MNKWFASIVAALLFIGAVAYAGNVPIFTGPAGTNPSQSPSIIPDLNSLTQQLNLAISPGFTPGGLTVGGGNVGIFSGGGFQLGVATLASSGLTTGTFVPGQGGSSQTNTLVSQTVKFFITFMASNGVQSYIPVWQ